MLNSNNSNYKLDELGKYKLQSRSHNLLNNVTMEISFKTFKTVNHEFINLQETIHFRGENGLVGRNQMSKLSLLKVSTLYWTLFLTCFLVIIFS